MNLVNKLLPRTTLRRRIARRAGHAIHGRRYRWCSATSFRFPFFIVGSGRCGSTLLRRLLQAHPGVHIPPENWAMGSWVSQFSDNRARLGWEELCGVLLNTFVLRNAGWFDGIPVDLFEQLNHLPENSRTLSDFVDCLYRYHAHLHAETATRWGDKTPLNVTHMPAILKMFPDAKFIFLLRDPADVVFSWSKIPLYSDDMEGAARRWKEALDAYSAMKRTHGDHVLEVRYEDLVSDTMQSMTRVAGFLDLSYRPEWINQTEHFAQIGDIKHEPHLQAAITTVTSASVAKGRKQLSRKQLESLQEMIGNDTTMAGYEPFVS